MAQTTVNFNLKTAGFANYANQTLTFRLLTAGADKTDDTVTLAGVVTATSAANGTGSVALFNNGDSDINSIFEVIFPNREKAKFLIPAGTSSIHLSDLLVDHVPSGSDTQQSSVYAAAIQRANHTGTQLLNTISDAGTIASQASNSVSISGGSISGVTLTASTANLTDLTGTNVLATTTLGYTTGSGGTVTQGTSKSTDVSLDKINGEIVMHNQSFADRATFTFNNTTIAATDVVIVNIASGGTAGAYQVTVGAVAANSCIISILNVSGGSLGEVIKLNFAVIKAVQS
jgi:hypothetical protein